ncbi:MAG TPA: lysylphosphatidylglycerol synthase domain-containing protein, partial [Chloroflexota bacterium]|nr:lysylphosphatidylglycerol synthase domain-containing protein [Chloroflexota bacterium]
MSTTVAPAPPATRPAWKRNAQIGVGLAISLLCLWLAFRGLELGEVWRALTEARYWLLLPALALYFGGVWVRAVRWGYLLRPVTPAPPCPPLPGSLADATSPLPGSVAALPRPG